MPSYSVQHSASPVFPATESDRMRAETDAALDSMAEQFKNVGVAAKAAARAFGQSAPRVSRKFRISDALIVAKPEASAKLQAQLMAMQARGDLEEFKVSKDDQTFQTIVMVIGKTSSINMLDRIITESFT